MAVRFLIVQKRVVPTHMIYHCYQCEYIDIGGREGGAGNKCWYDDASSVGYGIPKWCPMLEDEAEAE